MSLSDPDGVQIAKNQCQVNPLPRILVVEDEPEIMAGVRLCLNGVGYRVLEAENGERGLTLALSENPDLVILDVILPQMNGFDVCTTLRRQRFAAPILMLTTRGEVPDHVKGLSLGADDYLAKPFDARELLARVNALLRRLQREKPPDRLLRFGPVTVDLRNRTVFKTGKALALTKTEFALLDLLASTPGELVTREQMLAGVWGYTYLPNTRTVDTHIWRLRKKLGDDADAPKWIKCLAGRGYILDKTAIQ